MTSPFLPIEAELPELSSAPPIVCNYRYLRTDGLPMFKKSSTTVRVPSMQHIHMLGATGSGKTNKLLTMIDANIARGSRVCVIDLRGDLVDRILTRLAGLEYFDPQRLCLVDLRDQEQVVGFNPLAGAGDIHSRAYHVLSVIKHHADSWGIQIDETMRNSLVLLAECGLTLLELEPLLTNRTFRQHLVRQSSDPYVHSFFNRFDGLSLEKQLTWTLPVLNKITPYLAMPRLRRMLGAEKCVDVKTVFQKRGNILLISLAVDRLHEAAHLMGGLFISAIHHQAMSRADLPEAKRPRVLLIIDEFETMASTVFEQIIAEGRRFGLGLTLAHQSLSQIPPRLKSLIRGNVYTSYFFGMGAEDASEISREFISGAHKPEDWRNLLQQLQLGDHLLVQRGSPILGHSDHVLDPAVTADQLCTLKAASQARWSQPAIEIDATIFARILAHSASTHQQMEVHHDKSPNLPF